jgi:hypothetical protein
MNRTAFCRKAFFTAGMFVINAGVLSAQERTAEKTRPSEAARAVSSLHVESESLLRVEFSGRTGWGHVKKGVVLEGRLLLPLYAGQRVAAPTDSRVRVTVNSVEKVREALGFWRKTGRAIVRAFNPLETSRPSEYHVELSAAELRLPTGEVLPIGVRVLRAGNGVMVEPKTKSLQPSDKAREKSKASGMLLMAVREEGTFSVPGEQNPVPIIGPGEQGVARAYLLTALRSSLNHEGDKFRAQLAEPVRVAGRAFAPGSIVEGTVVRAVAPRMLSRAGSLYLRVDRIVPTGGEILCVGGSLSAAEADAQVRFALDEEGTLHGRKPGTVNGLVDMGYAYALGKISDDVSETPLRAISAAMSDAAVANAARYVGLGTSLAFLVTRRGRDVYLPKYALIEINFGRVGETATAILRDSSE